MEFLLFYLFPLLSRVAKPIGGDGIGWKKNQGSITLLLLFGAGESLSLTYGLICPVSFSFPCVRATLPRIHRWVLARVSNGETYLQI